MRYFFLLSLLLSGCGYQWGPPASLPVVAVPYIAGDAEGTLTSELTKTVAASGLAHVAFLEEASYFIDVQMVDANHKVIGYGRVAGELSDQEARKTVTVQAALREKKSGKAIFGPIQIEASTDYDYISQGTSRELFPFSLVQLATESIAEETAMRPLEGELARKIVDALFRSWYTHD